MYVSTLLSAAIPLLSFLGALATPVDPPGEAQGAAPKNIELIRRSEEHGRQTVNAWLFTENLDKLDELLQVYMKHPDPRELKWQRNARTKVRQYWTCTDLTESLHGNGLIGFEKSLEGLQIRPPAGLSIQRPEAVKPVTAVYPDGPWVKMKLTQDKQYDAFPFAEHPRIVTGIVSVGDHKHIKNLPKIPCEATGSSYENLYDIVNGILIVQATQQGRPQCNNAAGSSYNPGPTYLTDLQVPTPHSWAELTYHVWNDLRVGSDGRGDRNTKLCKHYDWVEGVTRGHALEPFWPYGDSTKALRIQRNSGLYQRASHLDYIIVPDIAPTVDMNKILLTLIRECLWSRDVRKSPTMEHREIFGVGHWCFYALLGAGNERIALLLAQHRDTDSNTHSLGHKIIKSISIFRPAEKQWPSLLFSIADYDAKWDNLKQQIEASWMSVQSDDPYPPTRVGCHEDL